MCKQGGCEALSLKNEVVLCADLAEQGMRRVVGLSSSPIYSYPAYDEDAGSLAWQARLGSPSFGSLLGLGFAWPSLLLACRDLLCLALWACLGFAGRGLL